MNAKSGSILDRLRHWQSDLCLVNVSVLLTPLILLSPIYLAGKALFWGTPLLQFVPWWSFAWQSLLDGHLPLWNPDVGMGAPLLANYQSALFYPPNWTYFLAYLLGGVKAIAWWQAPILALHLAWAGLGMAMLARRLGLGVLAQAVAGLAFGLSGYLVARASFLSINAAVAWLPWVIWCVTPKMGTKHKEPLLRPDIVWVVCLAMLFLAGHAQTAWYTLLLAVLWLGFWQWNVLKRKDSEAEPGSKPRLFLLRPYGRFMLALFIAVGIAAIQLLPTAEYLSQSQRASAVDFDYAMIYSFWPWRLLTLLAPGMFGSPVTGDYWGYANYWEDALYIGLLPLLLAIGTVFSAARSSLRSWARRRRGVDSVVKQDAYMLHPYGRLVGFLCIIGLIGLILALGDNTPAFPWLYRHVPTFNMFQAPARWLLWVEFSLALLAALGAESWRKPQGWGLYWTRLGTAGAFSITLGAGYTWMLMGDISPSFIRATAMLGLWGIGAGLLSLAAPEREPPTHSAHLPVSNAAAAPGIDQKPGVRKTSLGFRKRLFQFAPPGQTSARPGKPYPLRLWQWAVVVFVAVDLLVAGWGLNPPGDLALYEPAQGAERLRYQLAGRRLFFPPKQEYWIKYVRFLQFDTFNPGENWDDLRAALLANTNMLDGIPSVNNFDPLTPGRYTDWLDLLAEVSLPTYQELLRLMDVGVVQTLNRSLPHGLGLHPLEGGARLRWVPCPRYAIDAAHARQQIKNGGIDFYREVVLETGFIAEAVECYPNARGKTILTGKTEALDPNRLVIEVEADEAGWLVISDTWYPGWRAWVDGMEKPILHANYLFRAVELPAGEHQVILGYRPLSFFVGLAVSLVSLLLVFILWRNRLSGYKETE